MADTKAPIRRVIVAKPKEGSSKPARTIAPLVPIEFAPAERRLHSLLIGLWGPSGSGKSLSALKLAYGLAMGNPIAVIDSENKRALFYAPPPGVPADNVFTFDFFHATIKPPFMPRTYTNAIAAAAKLKPRVIIVDGITQEWMGTGGILDMVDEAGGTFADWKIPKRDHNGFMNRMGQMPCHFILTMRAKEKLAQVNSGGKWDIINTGWHPICEGGVPYDMAICLFLEKGIPTPVESDEYKTIATMGDLIPTTKPLTSAVGRALAEWCDPMPEWNDDEVNAIEVKDDNNGSDEGPTGNAG